MTPERRKAISDIIDQLDNLLYELFALQDKEKNDFYNQLIELQDKQQKIKVEEILASLGFAIDSLGDAVKYLRRIVSRHD